MTKLNDITSTSRGLLVCQEITREGMPLYAVILIHADNTAEILRTALDERIALTMLNEEIYRKAKVSK